jgi:hypothetical protein
MLLRISKKGLCMTTAVTILPPLKEKRKGDPTGKDPIEVWVAWVGEAWRKSVEYIILTGQRLAKLRDSHKHGLWEKAIEESLHLSPATVTKLIAIGGHKVLANPSHGKLLPPSWTTLYELSLMEDYVLEDKLDSREVHPGLERKDAIKLRKGGVEPAKKKAENPWVKFNGTIDRFCTATLKAAKQEGISEAEYAAAEVSKEEFVKQLNGLLVALKEFKKPRK